MEAFTLATCGAICRAACIEEFAQCCFTSVQECAYASQWNRSHSDTCQCTFRQCDLIARTSYS